MTKVITLLAITLFALLMQTPDKPEEIAKVDELKTTLNVELVEEFAEKQKGTASWYGGGEPLNVHTANGEVFDTNAFTCSLPDWTGEMFNKQVSIKNLRNGKTTICRVNDIGPAKRLNRIIDVTLAVKNELEMHDLEEVEITIL